MRAQAELSVSEAPSFDELSACVHCGMCLEVCPTYKELKLESDSPRGRLYLMRGLLQGQINPSASVLGHLDRCLDCRACETACPSSVPYGRILEKTRSALQPARPSSLAARFWRRFALDVLLPSRGVQRALFKIIWLMQVLGFVALARALGRRKLLPGWLSEASAQGAPVPFRSFRERLGKQRVFPAKGERRMRVALLTGCVADYLFAEVNAASVRVLQENGCDVEVVQKEQCCGALHIHNGARNAAKVLARENVRVFGNGDYDAIVSSAPGCSAELRAYGELLDGDPAAEAFAHKVRDITEVLCELGPLRNLDCTPAAADEKAPVPANRKRVAYDEPCHLLHAQRITDPPKRLMAALPDCMLVPLEDADACCGGAGIYWLQQPDLSQKIASRKIECIARSGAEIVATGNPGCMLQLRNAVRAAGLSVKVMHPIELVASAYDAQPRRLPP